MSIIIGIIIFIVILALLQGWVYARQDKAYRRDQAKKNYRDNCAEMDSWSVAKD